MTSQQQSRISTQPDGVLARGVLATRDRLTGLARRYPLLVAAALATVLLVLSLPPLTRLRGSNHVLSSVLVAAVVIPLAWRRRAPVAVCLIVLVLALVQWFTSRELTVCLAVLVAFYTVATHSPVRRVLAVAVLLEAATALAASNWPGASAVVAVWAGLIATGLLAAAGILGFSVRIARQARVASLADRAEQLAREQEQQARLAVAAERSRIARELHDIVAHNIAMMIALSDGAAATAAASPDQAVSLMAEISSAGRSALAEMRRLLGVLREPALPGHAPQPSLADLDNLLAGVRAAGVPTRLTVTGNPVGVPASAQLALYRMVQEALTNSLKHAPGASAEIRLSYRPDAVELEVTDDGCLDGSPPASGLPGSGQGLVGMRERAAVFGGDVTAAPRPGGGWRVHTILRLNANSVGRENGAGEDVP
jgi:signal transduction histidine kinase